MLELAAPTRACRTVNRYEIKISEKGHYIPDLSTRAITSHRDVVELMALGLNNRAVSPLSSPSLSRPTIAQRKQSLAASSPLSRACGCARSAHAVAMRLL